MPDNRLPDRIDEAFLPFSGLLESLSDLDGRVENITGGVQMDIEKVKLELPIQMEILVNGDEQIQLAGAPPLYYVETSVMPVFHQIKLTLTVNQ